MSRANYSDELDDLQMGRWRGQVASATRGKRGQAFLRDLLAALDALPEKRLIADELQTEDGEICTIAALGIMRGVDMTKLDPEDAEGVAVTFGIAEPLAREVVYMNDEYFDSGTPEERFIKMREWVQAQIKPVAEEKGGAE